MMWLRNLLFICLVLGGLGALGAQLYPRHLTPDKPQTAPAPDADFEAVVARVNAAFRQQWAELNLKPAPRAADRTVARRLALGLTGSIPSLQGIHRLEAYADPQALDDWLARLLEDRRHADYFAERLARAYVGNEVGPFIVYRRRRFVTWLSDQLLANRPHDDLVRELIAAPGLWTDRPATNFISVTIEPDNQKGPNPDRLAGRVTRAFLGVRLDCAQCHNHPFQPWKQGDYQGLAAFFGQTHQGFTGIYDGEGEFVVENRKTGAKETIAPRVPFAEELLPAEGTRRERLARWVTDAGNPWFARAAVNRVWALLFGRPLVEPVDDLASVGELPPVLEMLADDFRTHGYDLRRLIRIIAATDVFRLDSAAAHELTDAHEKAWAAFPMTRLRPEQVIGGLLQSASLETIDADSHILVRLTAFFGEKQFVERYGDTGEDEFDGRGGTIPQRLLLMNGQVVHEKTKENYLNAATRIAWMAPTDAAAVETAYLAVLTRRPTADEAVYFTQRLAGARGKERTARLEDLYWVLVNATEFAWNH
jgi:Protein of unknown function (DUF1549)/Protein of unknown function (DUF1553)